MRTKEQTYFPSLWKKVYYVVLLGRQNSSLLCSASLRPIIYFIYLFIYLFIYIFICLFIYLFNISLYTVKNHQAIYYYLKL